VKSSNRTQVELPKALHLQSLFFAATSRFWRRLANIETAVLSDELSPVAIREPIYVSGLARSGTTILTEMLERHPDLTSHRYSDFPNVWTPYWRNYLLQKTRREQPARKERTHRDRIEVSNDSPEAVEEVLWMHFFPQCRTRTGPNTLDGQVSNPAFESFYSDHIRKLLLVRNRPRYLAKGNYNLARFVYLLKLFPDARFLIPYRNPINHIASLAKQHRLFMRAHTNDPRISRQLALSGHFEFGANRSAIHFGDEGRHRAIVTAWAEGRDIEGWALYWAQTYQFLLEQAQSHADFAKASLIFSYENLCNRPEETIDRIIAHCNLDPAAFAEVRQYYCGHLSLPEYYQPDFSAGEIETIERICGPVASALDDFAK